MLNVKKKQLEIWYCRVSQSHIQKLYVAEKVVIFETIELMQ